MNNEISQKDVDNAFHFLLIYLVAPLLIKSQKVDKPMNVPVSRFKQAAKSPLGDVDWCLAVEFSHGFTSRKKRLHDNEPDQHQTVLILPGTRHASKQTGNEHGQIRDFDHRWQRYTTGFREYAERT